MAQTWQVTGLDSLVVHSGSDLTSDELPRLLAGSLVEELELDGERLKYRLLGGCGPLEGWVTLGSDTPALARVPPPERPAVPIRGTWFQEVFGFQEVTMGEGSARYQATRLMFAYDPRGGLVSRSIPDRVFRAGVFRTPSLAELRQETDLVAAGKALAGELAVSEVVGSVDKIHAIAANRGALFQAASQFNALEHTSERGQPEHGITCYAGDRTQGPACATTCAPGTVVRNYFALGGQGQTAQRQVSNLADVEQLLNEEGLRCFRVQSGYTLGSSEGLRRLTDRLRGDEALKEAIRSRIRIGLQLDTEVVATHFGSRLYAEGEVGEHVVTQAYCSAVSVSYSANSEYEWAAFAQLVLDAAYEATLYAAVQNALRNPHLPGSRKVFLTQLGGGVFGNNMEWIRGAMQRACQKFKGIGLEVYTVSYG